MKLACWLAALPALAQVTRVDIAGVPSPLIVGQTARLSAAARDAAGNVVPGAALTWNTGNPSAVQVDAQGNLRAVGLGLAAISVAVGSVNGRIDVTTRPLRVDLDPPSANVWWGDRPRFSARILDLNRQPIPGATATWQILAPDGFLAQGMSVDQNGVLDASLVGRYTVRATSAGVSGTAPVDIRIKTSYRLSRVFSNDPIPGPHRIGGAARAVFSENGRFAIAAQLAGWAQAALLWDGGFSPLMAAGETDWGFNRLRLDFGIRGVTSRGETLIAANGNLMVATPGKVLTVLSDDVWLGYARNLGGFFTGPHAINDSGEIAFHAARYQYVGTTKVLSGVFKVRANQLTTIWTSDQPLEGTSGDFAVAPFSPLIDGQGRVYFRAESQVGGATRSAWYRSNGADAPRRVVAFGDAAGGSTVSQVSDLVVTESGRLVYMLGLANGRSQLVLQEPDGAATTNDLPFSAAVFAVDGAGRVLHLGNRGALFVWEGGSDRPLLRVDDAAPDGSFIAAIEAAGFDESGGVIAQIRTRRDNFALMKVDGEALLQNGDWMDVAVPPFLGGADSFVRGPVLRLKTGLGTLVESRPGGLEVLIDIGDPLPEGPAFNGSARFVDTGPLGVYFASANRLYRRTGAGYELVARLDARIDRFSVNPQGQAVVASGGGIYVHENGNTRLLADKPPFTDSSEVAIDERGRIMVQGRTGSGASGLFLYDGEWRTAALEGVTRFRGAAIRNSFQIKVDQDKFYTRFNLGGPDGTGGVIAFYRDGGWQVEMMAGDPVPGEPVPLGDMGAFDVNARGEVLAVVFGGLAGNRVLLKSGAGFKRVYDEGVSMDGSYLAKNPDLLLLDDGTAYLSAFDQSGRFIIARADPL